MCNNKGDMKRLRQALRFLVFFCLKVPASCGGLRFFNMTPIDILAWVPVFAFTIPITSCQWFQPSTKRELWHVGDVHNIPYHTDLTSYTITLWQQAITGGFATPGPVIYG